MENQAIRPGFLVNRKGRKMRRIPYMRRNRRTEEIEIEEEIIQQERQRQQARAALAVSNSGIEGCITFEQLLAPEATQVLESVV